MSSLIIMFSLRLGLPFSQSCLGYRYKIGTDQPPPRGLLLLAWPKSNKPERSESMTTYKNNKQ
ncbi:hypothetical protein ASE74_18500 [Pedobacter sp. Leaf216]|nr:hypothetical protein ASE74_18500 [Pedobacter sp. Leaf216]